MYQPIGMFLDLSPLQCLHTPAHGSATMSQSTGQSRKTVPLELMD